MQRLEIPVLFFIGLIVCLILLVIEDLSRQQTKRYETCLKETKDAKVCQLVMRY
jgi:hypothetical protein